MAWTTPRTWVAGELVTAAYMNTHVRDNENLLKTSIADDGTLVGNGLRLNVVTKTTGYTLTTTDDIVKASGSGSVQTLPLLSGINGKPYTIKNVTTSGGTVTLMPSTSSQTIDGSTSYALSVQYQSITVVPDGTVWSII